MALMPSIDVADFIAVESVERALRDPDAVMRSLVALVDRSDNNTLQDAFVSATEAIQTAINDHTLCRLRRVANAHLNLTGSEALDELAFFRIADQLVFTGTLLERASQVARA